MSIWHPDSAEDRMAWVPIIGCFLPIVAVVVLAFAVVLL
jgi:hypothetical protein